MKPLTLIISVVTVFGVFVAGTRQPAVAAGPLAIKAGTLIPVAGEPIENAVILIRDGKIVAVGTDVEIPVEAQVIDASDKTVMPGFIDPHNPAGMSQANERNTNVPFLSAVDSIDPVLDYFEDCRRNGITTAAIFPGNSTMIGGRGAILKTAGSYVDDMLLRREAGLKISLAPVGGSRMSHLARLRRELEKAKKSLQKDADNSSSSEASPSPSDDGSTKEEDASQQESKSDQDAESESQETTEEQTSEGLAVMQRLLKGELPAFIYCSSAMDVGQAQKIVSEYQLKAVYILGRDCYKAADLLEKDGKPVILDPTLVFWETDPRTREDEQIVIPRIMMKAGIPFVFQADNSGTRQTLGSGFLWYQAATCVKYGMDRKDALRAMTLTAAETLDVDSFVGSIEPGKDADLVILSGDPLAADTWVETTLVAGEVVYRRSEDEKLKRLLEEPAE
jgi:imidazolonepropionase-like amidohydrolase